MHLFAGLGADADEARLNGPITARGNVCACLQCTAGNFNSCEMKALFGEVRRVRVPREKNQTSGMRQLASLQLWAAACKKGQLAATRLASDEAVLVGLYYLVLLWCAPFTLDKDTLFATDQFEKDDLVVRISYYRCARPLPCQLCLVVCGVSWPQLTALRRWGALCECPPPFSLVLVSPTSSYPAVPFPSLTVPMILTILAMRITPTRLGAKDLEGGFRQYTLIEGKEHRSV